MQKILSIESHNPQKNMLLFLSYRETDQQITLSMTFGIISRYKNMSIQYPNNNDLLIIHNLNGDQCKSAIL